MKWRHLTWHRPATNGIFRRIIRSLSTFLFYPVCRVIPARQAKAARSPACRDQWSPVGVGATAGVLGRVSAWLIVTRAGLDTRLRALGVRMQGFEVRGWRNSPVTRKTQGSLQAVFRRIAYFIRRARFIPWRGCKGEVMFSLQEAILCRSEAGGAGVPARAAWLVGRGPRAGCFGGRVSGYWRTPPSRDKNKEAADVRHGSCADTRKVPIFLKGER
jgi:hypothetical protein